MLFQNEKQYTFACLDQKGLFLQLQKGPGVTREKNGAKQEASSNKAKMCMLHRIISVRETHSGARIFHYTG